MCLAAPTSPDTKVAVHCTSLSGHCTSLSGQQHLRRLLTESRPAGLSHSAAFRAANMRTELTALGEEVLCCDLPPGLQWSPPDSSVPAQTVQLAGGVATYSSAPRGTQDLGGHLLVCAAAGAGIAVGALIRKSKCWRNGRARNEATASRNYRHTLL
eukprot:GHVT01086837.1.p1 GENE.GHVT01086837.1~~GHVT01086837.1.p1  ORF type:complete len:156 (+),score=23.86 GHVT01086837.1:1467-1934(+)